MRKFIAMLILLAYMAFYIWLIGLFGPTVTAMPRLVQLVFYILAGFVWIFPLRALFRWMNAHETPNDSI